ncbi:MAG: hypothetical protein HY881_00950 [Deltaproteobacteria bacterium]|nr:hypothetical protein [Deltaproteobacteria bacterium]
MLPVDLLILSVKERAARCRTLKGRRTITLRAKDIWGIVPGEIATVIPNKFWSFKGHQYLSGEVSASRMDIASLELHPMDDQGARFLIPEVRADKSWEDTQGESNGL